MLSIENLTETQELDTPTSREVTGGYQSLAFLDQSITQNIFTMNATSINIGAGDGGVVALGNLNLTTVAAGSSQSWIQLV